MWQLVPYRLWVGNALEARDVSGLLRRDFSAVVDLAMNEPPIVLPRELMSCRFPLHDGFGNSKGFIQAAIRAVESMLRSNIPTLLACSAGLSRSPAIAAAAVALVEGLDPSDALQRIVHGRPHDVSPTLWSDVAAACLAIRAERNAAGGAIVS